MSEFVKGVCCRHQWLVFGFGEMNDQAKAALRKERKWRDREELEMCSTCGAMCCRDAGGHIVEYDALFNWGEPIQLPEESDENYGRQQFQRKTERFDRERTYSRRQARKQEAV